MVRPLQKWLEGRGVKFQLNTRVTDLGLQHDSQGYTVDRILCKRNDHTDEIAVTQNDFVMVTLGSMTESSTLGSMDSAPVLNGKSIGGSWTLWEKIAVVSPNSGVRLISRTTSTNRSGSLSPQLFTTQPSSG